VVSCTRVLQDLEVDPEEGEIEHERKDDETDDASKEVTRDVVL